MDGGQNSAIAATLPSEKEIQYEGQTIAYNEHGQAIGIEEETTRQQALFIGVLLFVFGGVFFFIPLGMLISELQYADVEEMFCLIPFFSVFLIIGGALLVGSLFSLYSGFTGKGLIETVTFEELEEREESSGASDTAFSYTSREALLAQIHGSNAEESASPAPEEEPEEATESPSGVFWGVNNP